MEPRISANQLAEYTLTTPSRRHTIIRNAKYSPTFLVARYTSARSAICDYLSDDTRSLSKIHAAEYAQRKAAKEAATDFAKNDALLSAEAIRSFASTQFPSIFNRITFTKNTNQLPKLSISGVDVSVNLDLISRNEKKGLIGGVVIQTSKAVSSKSWREDHSACVASLAYMLANAHLGALGQADPKMCFAADVFASKIKQAPGSYKRRLKDIEFACSEIAMFWPTVTPPTDYDGE